MVVAYAWEDMVQLFQVLEDGHSDLDMCLNLAIFLGRQGAALLEHVVVDANLTDVVQQARQVEVAAF